eukprot:403366314
MRFYDNKYNILSIVKEISDSWPLLWTHIDDNPNNLEPRSLFLTATLSYMCYCKLEQFIVYIGCWIYIIIRTYYWAKENPLIKLLGPANFTVQLGLYLFLMLFFLYFFSRENQKRDRDVFKEKNNQRQVITLFNSIIRTHHDGITITQGEDIVFHNQQMSKIMNVENSKPTLNDSQQYIEQLANQSENNQLQEDRENQKEQQNLVKTQIIEAMRKTKIHKNQLIERLLLQMQMNQNNSEKMMVQNQNELLNTIWDYILIQNQQQELISSSKLTSNIQEGVNFKMKQQDQNGNMKSKQLQVFSQIINTGQKTFVVTTIRDMSHWMELEKEKNLTLYKTQAFASAAHEFRNPLGAIINSLELLKDSIDQRGNKFYVTAKNCSNLMLYLVNDILDYSQLESQKLLLNYELTKIQEILEVCTSVLKFRAELKDLEFSYSVDNSFPEQFMIDQNRLRQILINLLSNAIKYTDEGFVRIHCYFQSYKQQIVIEVQDSGVGIEKTQIENLLIAYKKIMKNRNMNKEGCGLGLTISKNLSKAMGGDLKVSSVVGQGSVFAIVLPFNPPSDTNEIIKKDKRVQKKYNSYTPQSIKETRPKPLLSQNENEDNFDIKLEFSQKSFIHRFSIQGKRIPKNKQQNSSQFRNEEIKNQSDYYYDSLSQDQEFGKPSDIIKTLDSQTPKNIFKNKNELISENRIYSPRLQHTRSSCDLIYTEIESGCGTERNLIYNLTNQDLNNQSYLQNDLKVSFQHKNQIKIENVQRNQERTGQILSLQNKSQNQQIILEQDIRSQHIDKIYSERFITRDQSIQQQENSKDQDKAVAARQPQYFEIKCTCPQILIADDDPFNIIALEGLINQAHIGAIDKAFNGRDALSKFELNYKGFQKNCTDHKAYKLVILDNQMPFLKGIEVGRKIREIQDINSQNANLVLLSGDDHSQQSTNQIQEIFDQIIKKPVSMADLKTIIIKVFGEQKGCDRV